MKEIKNLKQEEELKGHLTEEKLIPDEEKKTTPLSEHKVTDVVTYEIKDSKLVVETVPKFRNFQNYLNKPREKVRLYNKGEVIERVAIDYELFENPEFDLLYNQVEKIIIEGEKVETTRENLTRFLEKSPKIFNEVINKILENRGDMGFLKLNRIT